MSDKTPRLDLETFDVGDKPPWDHTDTVEATDQYAIVHGPIADRPDTGEYDDELYHAVDQNITWRWDQDAADWEYFAGQGSADQPVPGDSYYNGLLAGGLGGINDEPLPLTSDVNGGGDRSLTDLEKVGTEALEAGSVSTEQADIGPGPVVLTANGKTQHGFEGDTADERLSNAIDKLEFSENSLILEAENYSDPHTIDVEQVCVRGHGYRGAFSDLTIGGRRSVYSNIGVVFGDSEISVEAESVAINGLAFRGSGSELRVKEDDVTITNVTAGSSADIVFEDGTSGGEIAVSNSRVSVTDNGNNRIL